MMKFASLGYAVPRQGVEALAQLSERALRDFIGSSQGHPFGHWRTRMVALRSKLARYKKLFDGGLISEDIFFRQLRDSEAELMRVLTSVVNAEVVTADVDESDLATRTALERQFRTALREVSEARSRVVFVSYRRDDSAYIADRVAQHLRSRLGEGSVFRDTHSLEYGDEFAARIEDALSRTRVCLVLIGRRWRGILPDGSTRISQVDDFVRREVRAALGRRITVVPVLIEGVRVEEIVDLPPDVVGIRARQSITLRPDPDFDRDMERLMSFVVRRLF
jgi:hypothetical protein